MKSSFTLLLIIALNISAFSQVAHNRNADTFAEWTDVISYYQKANSLNDTEASHFSYAGTFGYMLLAEYGGTIRAIEKTDLEYFNKLLSSFFGQDAEGLFKHEVLLNTPEGPIYLPIQESLITYWKQELKEGDQMAVRIRAYGALKKGKDTKWFFGINSYGADEYEYLWETALESLNQGRKENGLNCIYKLMELDPTDGRNHAVIAYNYYSEGFPDNRELMLKSDSVFEISQKLSPDHGYHYYQRALVKIRLEEYKAAWSNIEMARKLGVPKEEFYEPIMQELEEALPYKQYLSDKKK